MLLIYKQCVWMQVIVGDESHIFQYEADGVSVLGGVGMHTVPTADNGELPLEALNKAVRWAASHQDATMPCRKHVNQAASSSLR